MNIDDFLLSLMPRIEQTARNLYYNTVRRDVDPQDLIQEGMIGAWKALGTHDPTRATSDQTLTHYCLLRARGAMLDYLRSENRTPATSLEAYLEIETDQGTGHREIAAPPTTRPKSLPKKPVHDALHNLSQTERMVVQAAFRIDSDRGRGKSPTPDEVQTRLHITADSYSRVKRRAIQKLPALMQHKQAVWS